MWTALIGLAALFAALNRFSGGGIVRDEELPGRPIYYAGALAIALLGLIYHVPGLIAGASFFVWRLPGWYGGIDMGKVHHTALRDWAIMSARGLLAFPIFLYTDQPAYFLAAFALLIGSTYWLASLIIKGDHVAAAEYGVGALWGVVLWSMLGGGNA